MVEAELFFSIDFIPQVTFNNYATPNEAASIINVNLILLVSIILISNIHSNFISTHYFWCWLSVQQEQQHKHRPSAYGSRQVVSDLRG